MMGSFDPGHLKCADRNFIDHICIFFISCLVHHHIPSLAILKRKNNAVNDIKKTLTFNRKLP